MRSLVLALAVLFVSHGPAIAQQPSSQVRSNALIEAIAVRGAQCGLLKAWEAAALRALAHQDRAAWPAEDIAVLRGAVADQIANLTCQSEMLTGWIEASRPGIEGEMLPPYLVAYKALAEMPSPPIVFNAATLRLDTSEVVAAIDRKLAALEASGQRPEGGGPWPAYIDRTTAAVLEFAGALTGEDADQAAAWIAVSAVVVEHWYRDGAP